MHGGGRGFRGGLGVLGGGWWDGGYPLLWPPYGPYPYPVAIPVPLEDEGPDEIQEVMMSGNGNGARPARVMVHEGSLDCRVRIWREGNRICGVCRCDTSYGPVSLAASADARVVGRLAELLSAGVPPEKAVARSLRATEDAIKKNLLEQASNVPTSSASPSVTSAGDMVDGLRRRDPHAVAHYKNLRAHENSGDTRAAAATALIRSVARHGGASTTTGAALPTVHRAGIAIPSPTSPKKITGADHARIAKALATAIAKSVPVRAGARPLTVHH